MSSAPPIEFTIETHAVWCAGVVGLAGVAGAVLLAWWWKMPAPTPPWATALALAGCAGAAVCAAGLVLQPHVRLRWDGREWSYDTATGQARTGKVGVAVDLGSWLLLRFVPSSARRLPWPPRVRWIAVQRAGLEARWHALRCTVYAPRPPASEPG